MRWLVPLAALAVLGFAQSAAAAPVSVAPVSISPTFQHQLERRYGEREGAVLQNMVADEVSDALERAGANVGAGAPITVETTIVSAVPNRATAYQLSAQHNLDALRTVSTGGAELHAVIRGADGHVLAEIDHRNYSPTLQNSVTASTWGDAGRAIDQFARKVARAYADNVH